MATTAPRRTRGPAAKGTRTALTVAATVAATLTAVLVLGTAALATPPDRPCQHGNSLQPCRPDPQPEHGGDCDEHGKNDPGQQDHCTGQEVTPTPSPSVQPSPTLTTIPDPAPSVGTTPQAGATPRVSHPRLATTGGKGLALVGVVGVAFFIVGLTLRKGMK